MNIKEISGKHNNIHIWFDGDRLRARKNNIYYSSTVDKEVFFKYVMKQIKRLGIDKSNLTDTDLIFIIFDYVKGKIRLPRKKKK